MSAREHECPRCGDRWHCDGCGSGEVERLCGPCQDDPVLTDVERALLERDVAEVERESRSLSERSVALAEYVGLYRSQAKACHLLIRIDPKSKKYKQMLGMRIGELTGAERGRRWVDRRSADCQAWLTRARAALGQ